MESLSVLIVGGTGVSGVPLIASLLREGFRNVSILHSGTHRPDKEVCPWYYDGSVNKIYANAFKESSFKEGLLKNANNGKVYFDIVCSMYGNLAMIAKLFATDANFKCSKFISIGGFVLFDIHGTSGRTNLKHIVDETFPIQTTTGDLRGKPNSHNVKIDRIALAEQAVFRFHPNATHLRYPIMYGPLQLAPDEYMVVKRIVDKRKFMILPEGFEHYPRVSCSGENGAEYVMLTIKEWLASRREKRKAKCDGEVFSVVEDEQPTQGQWVEIIAKALDSEFEVVSLPFSIAKPGLPLVKECKMMPCYVYSNEKAKRLLGYKDKVSVTKAIEDTARWLKNELQKGRVNEEEFYRIMQDPFDYKAEDELVSLWGRGEYNACLDVAFERPVGMGAFYYGDGVNPADNQTQQQRHSGEYKPHIARRVKSNL